MTVGGGIYTGHSIGLELFDFCRNNYTAATAKDPDAWNSFKERYIDIPSHDHYRAIISEVGRDRPLLIGGKSMGGRMASMLAAETPGIADGLVLLGYPFHPPGKPEKLRTDHLADIKMPTLLVQGERDTFGGTDLVNSLSLPSSFDIQWAIDGDHGFKPRKKSGRTEAENWDAALTAIAEKRWPGD